MAAVAFGQAVYCLPVQGQLAHRLHAHALAGELERIFRHDLVRALAHVAERCGIGHRVIDVDQQQAPYLRCVLLTTHLLCDERLLRTRATLFLQLLHVVSHCIDQIVGELPVAQPGVAQ
ncbi:hypothetical protein ALO61_200179 [Pseudomonas savastanoi pv. nerii]|nr:hypothetical protein ALO61_200179 [Pseudomonas savastanoi pv. nerii]